MKPHQDTPLWSLRSPHGRETTAVLRYVEDYGYELRMLLDGELWESRMFRRQGDKALAYAREKRRGLEEKGWRELEAVS